MTEYGIPDKIGVDARRLWAGGAATAVVAALAAVVGILIARGLAHVSILAPKATGVWGDASTATYALLTALFALAATGLMHLLSVTTPKPTVFFGWIMVLITLVGVVLPLSLVVEQSSKIATALLNLVLGLVITLLVESITATALRVRRTRPPADPSMPTRRWDA